MPIEFLNVGIHIAYQDSLSITFELFYVLS